MKQICDHGLIGHCKFQVQLTPCFSFHSSYTELVWFYIWWRNRDPCTVFREDPVLSSNNLIKYPSTSAHIGSYPLAVLCFRSYFRPNIFGKKTQNFEQEVFRHFLFLVCNCYSCDETAVSSNRWTIQLWQVFATQEWGMTSLAIPVSERVNSVFRCTNDSLEPHLSPDQTECEECLVWDAGRIMTNHRVL